MIDLGQTTERRFAEVFAASAIITRKAAAGLLGVDERTLDSMTDEGIVRAVRRGNLRAYAERDLRAYLAEGPPACRSTERPSRPISNSISSGKVVAFTGRPARLRSARRKS
jgi:phage terminase Nu1 subunit (DNA packaging protein)